ncbi:MAG: anaerobic glycerol-3-phosphate dehydrogenase subunit C [Planctomycetaceae bacterium]|nr:anaerobic glycerol-3-phosphate dehydrogenase subunit C [Planctomycetaceae bacterium]
MEDVRRQIAEDLVDSLEGDLRIDDVTTALYATDASLYEIKPLAVAFPRSTGDVELLAAYSSRSNIPLIARGAGTGLAGGCLGRGIVLDFSRYMNRLIAVDRDTVRVQPGITRAALNARLKEHGRYFAPDPSNSAITTIGGMIGVDAAGSHAFRVGSTRDHLQSLQCVLMGGQTLELGREVPGDQTRADRPQTIVNESPSAAGGFAAPVLNETLPLADLTPATRRVDLMERLSNVLQQAAEEIETHQPPLLRNCSGYMLRGVLSRGGLDFPRLLAGSEGTLGIITEATLHTMPISRHRGMMVLMFGSMEAALQAMQVLLVLEPGACDLLDRRLLSLARDSDSAVRDVVRSDAEAGLFLEFNGISASDVQQKTRNANVLLNSMDHQFVTTRTVFEADEIDFLWTIPGSVVSLLARLRGDSRPLAFVEDIAVPPAEISGFLKLAQKAFQKHEVTATLYAHAASGQLHLRPMLPTPLPGRAEQVEAIARDLYRHVKTVGGTISGEHGDGLSRTAFIRSQYGPLYSRFKQVKEIFDPQKLLNPDKIISDDGRLTVRNLRRVSARQEPPASDGEASLLPILQLNWSEETAIQTASRCNGCGSCRTTSILSRMCPFFHEGEQEALAPRGKANLLRRLVSGEEPEELLSSQAAREVAESCFNCKQCELECPSGVDIPHLMLEARAQNVAVNGLDNADWLLSRFHTYARFASRFTIMANRLIRYGISRAVLRKTLGLAEKRRLPRFARRPFLKSPRVRSEHNTADPTSQVPTVVYFVDYFANHHDPQLAEAFVRILQHNGFRVHIPQQQSVSGMAMIAVGDLDAAREVADANIAELSEHAREGYPIVCTEPSAALCLKNEYPLLSSERGVQIVAEQTFDAGTFLWDLHQQGRLRKDFTRLDLQVAYHTPCHVKALGPQTGLCNLMELIPGVEVVRIEKGCSGMAGTFGLAAEHFEQSLSIGKELIDQMKTIRVDAGITDCSSCRMQMEQAASIPTVHPLKIMAFAYGLMPELEAAFKSRPFGNIMS